MQYDSDDAADRHRCEQGAGQGKQQDWPQQQSRLTGVQSECCIEQKRRKETEEHQAGIQRRDGCDPALLDEQPADHQGHRVRHSDAPRKHTHERRAEQEQGELARELLRGLIEHVGFRHYGHDASPMSVVTRRRILWSVPASASFVSAPELRISAKTNADFDAERRSEPGV